MSNKKNGFTLIEVLTVIAILGIIALLVFGNFIRSLKKARDSRRKQDLNQIRTALDVYYSVHEAYPTATEPPGLVWGGTLTDDDDRVFMQKLPSDVNANLNYVYQAPSTGDYFILYSCLENTEDIDYDKITPIVEPDCGDECSNTCHYGISSSNKTP
jgi:prepilin-type N-terminal cleavage/methylation domain-containing protein